MGARTDDAQLVAGAAPRARPRREVAAQHASGERRRRRAHVGDGSLDEQLAALPARTGTEIDQMVRGGDDLRRVLDDDHRVALVANRAQHAEQLRDVARVQADRGLVEDVERRGERAAERRRELDALRLAARERAHLAVEREIAETDFVRGADARAQRLEHARRERLLRRRERQRRPANASSSAIVMRVTSPMWRPPTVTASASPRSRVPSQSGQRSKRR